MSFAAITDNENIIDGNKWHFNPFLKHVQKSIMQLYLQKVTVQVIPQASAISESLKSP